MNWVLPFHIVVCDLSVTNVVTQTKCNELQYQTMSVTIHKVSHSYRKCPFSYVFVQTDIFHSFACDVWYPASLTTSSPAHTLVLFLEPLAHRQVHMSGIDELPTVVPECFHSRLQACTVSRIQLWSECKRIPAWNWVFYNSFLLIYF